MTDRKRYEIKFWEAAVEIIDRNRATMGGLSANKFVNLVVLQFGDRLWTNTDGNRVVILTPDTQQINQSLVRIPKSIAFDPIAFEVVQRNCKRLAGLSVNRFVNAVVIYYGDRLRLNQDQSNDMLIR
ncbi:MAG: hypothetical protein ACRC62_08705 [Microcoleus sp.]